MLPAVRQNETSLTKIEQQKLEALEEVISDNLVAFYQVGKALSEIRDSKLYRQTHQTFEDYVADRWGMSRDYAYKLVTASEVVDNVDHGIQKPTSERQARPLTALPPQQQQQAWKEAVETAPKGKVTAKHVAEVVERRTTPATPKQQSHKYQIQQVSDALSFATMAISQLERIRKDDPKREEALNQVESWIRKHRVSPIPPSAFQRAYDTLAVELRAVKELDWETVNKQTMLDSIMLLMDIVEK